MISKVLLFFFALWMGCDQTLLQSVCSEEYKQKISQKIEEIKKTPLEQQSEMQRDLAVLYYRDQDHEKAFKLYLDALKGIHENPQILLMTKEEDIFYNKALEIYLSNHAKGSQIAAEKIRQEYGPILTMHPEYYHLGFIVAVAAANLELFEEFFQQFYRSYVMLPQHYLAFKTKAILHSKLFARASSVIDREIQRQAILDNLTHAIQKNSSDASLYKLLLITTLENQRGSTVKFVLDQIFEKSIIIPRSDLAFYVEQAVITKQIELARRFVEQSRQWYQHSRVIDAAQKYIDERV